MGITVIPQWLPPGWGAVWRLRTYPDVIQDVANIGDMRDESDDAHLAISHSMEDVVAVADRVVVLKAGRKVAESSTQGLTPSALAHAVMTGSF